MKIPNWIGKNNDEEKTYEIKKKTINSEDVRLEFMKTSCDENKKTIDEDKLESLRIEMERQKNSWIWVDGYKGMDSKMEAYGGFKYELNKEYEIDESFKICKQGFHLCLKLEDVFRYYKLEGCDNRFFKVKALVNEYDYKNYGRMFTKKMPYSNDERVRIDKIVSKKIVVEKEISNEELFKIFEEEYKKTMLNITLNDFVNIKKYGYDRYRINLIKHCFKEEFELSELFIELLFENLDLSQSEKLFNFAKAIWSTEVNSDIFIYLLLKEKGGL